MIVFSSGPEVMWSYPSFVRQWKSMVAAGFISGRLGCVEVVRGWLRL